MYIKILGLLGLLFSISSCEKGIKSQYKGGITKDTLIGHTWQQKNSDFTGTYQRWFFLNDSQIVYSIRGASSYYEWETYELTGTVKPNPDNQVVFKLKSGAPGGTLYQYLLIWFINVEGTTAVFQVYTTPEDIIRYLVNVNGAVSSYNYERISTE